jgi:hypothetical protein
VPAFRRRQFQERDDDDNRTEEALRDHHSDDLTALRKLYEHHAEDCVRMATLTVDPQRREEYLNLASGWTEAAAALGAPKH